MVIFFEDIVTFVVPVGSTLHVDVDSIATRGNTPTATRLASNVRAATEVGATRDLGLLTAPLTSPAK